MVNFNYYNPANIIFGRDTESQLADQVKQYGSRVLLHYDDFIPTLPVYKKVKEILENAGVTLFELGGVVPNPKLSLCYEGIELCKREKIDLIIAIGGGSSIDSAKTIGVGVVYDGDVWDFYTETGINPADSLPVGVVLTIPASGSETSSAAVVTQESTGLKRTAYSSALVPKFVIMNPENTFSLPAYQTACGGYDIISHLLERYFSPEKNVDFTDRIIEGAIRSMLYQLPIVLETPDDYNARAEVMFCGTNAHSGLFGAGRVGDWATHDLAHEVSALYNTAHGCALAILFPAWMEYVYKSDVDFFTQFAQRIFDVDLPLSDKDAIAREGIHRLKAFTKSLGLPTSLSEIDIDESGFDEMADKCLHNRETVGQFQKLTRQDVYNIFMLAK